MLSRWDARRKFRNCAVKMSVSPSGERECWRLRSALSPFCKNSAMRRMPTYGKNHLRRCCQNLVCFPRFRWLQFSSQMIKHTFWYSVWPILVLTPELVWNNFHVDDLDLRVVITQQPQHLGPVQPGHVCGVPNKVRACPQMLSGSFIGGLDDPPLVCRWLLHPTRHGADQG